MRTLIHPAVPIAFLLAASQWSHVANARITNYKYCLTLIHPSVPIAFLLAVSQWSQVANARITNYKYCLYECGNCVMLWGDELYDGKKCATCCQYSNGLKMDPECKVWVKNRIAYTKKDQDYVDSILSSQKRSDRLNYKTIFAQEDIPEYCFGI